jgi:hypothetical protein
MMIMLRDDPVIEIFESPDSIPNSIEVIDVENGVYKFCDDQGQRYVGHVTRSLFGREKIELRPEGSPDVKNFLDLIDRAEFIEPNDRFPDLQTLREYTTKRFS